ncbi:MAG: response regulator [Pseudomonadota bacterium]
MQTVTPTLKGDVFLVDDDMAVRRGVAALLSAAEYNVFRFKSAEEFLEDLNNLEIDNAVLLVDVCMPGIQGLELQEKLSHNGVTLPVVVMTAHGDIPMAVRAMRNGAIDFLEKPFTVEEVTSALDRALSFTPQPLHSDTVATQETQENFNKLTAREKDILLGIVDGDTNKEIARKFEISPRTVETHRQKVMLKMNADNFAELIRMAVSLNLDGPR